MEQLIKNVVILEAEAPVSASSSIDNNSDIIDMSGYDGIVFIVPITDSDAGGVATLKVEGNTVNSDSGMAALTDASATKTCVVSDDLNGKLLIVDVKHPVKRYLQAVETSSVANIAYGNIIAIKYHGHFFPITEDDTVLDSAAVVGA